MYNDWWHSSRPPKSNEYSYLEHPPKPRGQPSEIGSRTLLRTKGSPIHKIRIVQG